MLLCFYPTSVLVLDDEPLFLESFRFRFGDLVACRLASTPQTALTTLREPRRNNPPLSAIIKSAGGSSSLESREALETWLPELLAAPDRFDTISVVVVDFDMPQMNGVQFCRAIADLPVKKIMLTGKAGATTAIEAFNEGAIDYFIKKEQPDFDRVLERQIPALQQAYFSDLTHLGTRILAAQDWGFLNDDRLAVSYAELCQSLDIVEYYIVPEPPGMLMIDRKGSFTLALFAHASTLRAHHEIASAQDAPSPLLELLSTRRIIPWFPTVDGYYNASCQSTWSQHIYPIHLPCQRSDWLVALVAGSEVGKLVQDDAISWARQHPIVTPVPI